MRVSLNWLKEYLDIPVSLQELANKLTMLGLEIEAIEQPGAEIKNVVVGKIQAIEPHPDADKLVVCKTDVGTEQPLQIICGAKNMSVGDNVPTALVGATLHGGLEISKRKVRGVESCGMMCSPSELGRKMLQRRCERQRGGLPKAADGSLIHLPGDFGHVLQVVACVGPRGAPRSCVEERVE